LTTAGSSGSLATGLTLNQAASGYHTIFAAGETSRYLGIATIEILPELTVSPTTVSPGRAITIEGYGFSPFVNVNLTISKTVFLGRPLTTTKGTFEGVSCTVPSGTSPGVYTIYATQPNYFENDQIASTTLTVE
jgi:hypothetical protein